MDGFTMLAAFFKKAAKDSRIGVMHIGLCVTLLQMMAEQGFDRPLETFSSEVMKNAKIYSTATYHRLMKDLNAYGYIVYKPSFYKGKGSRISLAYLGPA